MNPLLAKKSGDGMGANPLASLFSAQRVQQKHFVTYSTLENSVTFELRHGALIYISLEQIERVSIFLQQSL